MTVSTEPFRMRITGIQKKYNLFLLDNANENFHRGKIAGGTSENQEVLWRVWSEIIQKFKTKY